ncbi:FAD dependent oxidoreductase [Dactylonectria macrodidyma]|uniref:FAD dependent oxidoreductase n=1 Tax=Dactylonectria macrodidyma TaxID=307937 RepID=A0A9P9DVG1_9HYPO|nr:FAD dependent oxidoreductase [Dactylonectria macrodidyma]
MTELRSQKELIPNLLSADPQLPCEVPTESYWQRKPHVLAEKRSVSLPTETDVVIIGSGMTSLGVTKRLLSGDTSLQVAVLEARTLCSGATGRNGGQLAINAAETYEDLRATFGPGMAGAIVKFTIRTLERVREVIKEYGVDEAELGEVVKLRACMDQTTMEKMRKGVTLLESDHPSLKDIYQLVDGETCIKSFGVHGAVGGATLPAGVVWPYRMVCNVFQHLLQRNPDRLSIDTRTPVTSVTYDPDSNPTRPYVVKSTRGTLRAAKVIHCTNGHSGHLVPNLCGRIFPLTGTMSVQDMRDQAEDIGTDVSWAIHQEANIDEDGLSHDGLQYLLPNAKSKLFFHGGDRVRVLDAISADDSKMYAESVALIQNELQRFFGAKSQPEVVSAWSGTMCFTADSTPLVGRLPTSLTTRQGNDEWIAAGYNGYGMPNAFLCGEVLASLVMGQEVPEYFPKCYSLNEARLCDTLTIERAINLVKAEFAQ